MPDLPLDVGRGVGHGAPRRREAAEVHAGLDVGSETVDAAGREQPELGVVPAAERVGLEVELALVEDVGRRNVEDRLLGRERQRPGPTGTGWRRPGARSFRPAFPSGDRTNDRRPPRRCARESWLSYRRRRTQRIRLRPGELRTGRRSGPPRSRQRGPRRPARRRPRLCNSCSWVDGASRAGKKSGGRAKELRRTRVRGSAAVASFGGAADQGPGAGVDARAQAGKRQQDEGVSRAVTAKGRRDEKEAGPHGDPGEQTGESRGDDWEWLRHATHPRSGRAKKSGGRPKERRKTPSMGPASPPGPCGHDPNGSVGSSRAWAGRGGSRAAQSSGANR